MTTNYKTKDKRVLLRAAFNDLRGAGYYARQNFNCCMGCAIAAVPEGETMSVLYHSQDNKQLADTGSCYVQWDGDAHEIMCIFNKHKIKTMWGGTSNDRIMITLPMA